MQADTHRLLHDRTYRKERDAWHACAREQERDLSTCIRNAVRLFFHLDKDGNRLDDAA